VNANIAVFGSDDADIPRFVFAETSEKTLPPGFVGSLDRSTIHLPAAVQTGIKTETVLLTLTSKDDATSGDYSLSPALFSNDIEGTPFMVSSSFVVHIE
jgi:hypothetical protein